MAEPDVLLGDMAGSERTELAGMTVDAGAAGDARIRRIVYPPGYRWSVDIRPVVGGDVCEHAHVGFLARGRLAGRYEDGCEFDYQAPQVVAIEPGHDAWVGDAEPAVLIEVDFERETVGRLGMAARHAH
jgi:hypothetical protein